MKKKVCQMVVNDIHSQLNQTRVASILRPKTAEEVVKIVHNAKKDKVSISISGSRHSMGGQQFGADDVLIDTRGLNNVTSIDLKNGIITAEAGIEWPELIAYLQNAQNDNEVKWVVKQKQTGADRLSLGGALSSNVHGRGLIFKPIIDDIECFEVVDADGNILKCNRDSNYELFKLCIGGYGLFGIIVSVSLRLMRGSYVERVVIQSRVDEIGKQFIERIKEGYLYGDFQFITDENSNDYLNGGVLSCYRPIETRPNPILKSNELSASDWSALYLLSHTDKKRASEEYIKYYLSTSGQIYDSAVHQQNYYQDNYHAGIDQKLGSKIKATEMITEIYVPKNQFVSFMKEANDYFKSNCVNVVYGTVRTIEQDTESFLTWAKKPYMCIIFNVHVIHTESEINKAIIVFRRLIDYAIYRDGSFFLTYHRWATKKQIETCYPEFKVFLNLKKKYDPFEIFQSDWYRHYYLMFNTEKT
jgi:hypothetical protein